MTELKRILRSFFKKKENNFIKIFSLGTGLAVGLIIITKVFFEFSYDEFYPHSDRICRIQTNFKMGKDEPQEFSQVSGGVAPGMKTEIPEVESATRLTYLESEAKFFTSDKKYYKGTFILADSCFYDVLPRPMIQGNAKEILAAPMYAIVSESISKKLGNSVIGQSIELENYPGQVITIGGVFKDVPENTHLRYDVVISLASIKNFMGDGSLNWIGNDRYQGYVKLITGTETTKLAPAIRKMQERYQPMDKLKELGIDIHYTLFPLNKIHSDAPEVKRMAFLLSAIAFALIFASIMNFILILISNLVNRGKVIAVYKCYGADEKSIAKLIFKETSFHLGISLIVSLILIFCFKDVTEEILSVSVCSLFSFRSCLLLAGICIFISLIIGLIPAYLFSRIPVSLVFRSLTMMRSSWKIALLFSQLLITTFLLSLLVVVSRQYNVMVHDNPGYSYERLLYFDTKGISNQEKQKLMDLLQTNPQVEMVSTSDCLPFNPASGNNVSPIDSNEEFFNVADLYRIDENFIPLMEITIMEGKAFDKESSKNEIVISKKFADRLSEITNWSDGVIGKEVRISEHGNVKIVGVYSDIRLGSISNVDSRPSVMFYSNTPNSNVLVKLRELNAENIQKVYDIFKQSFPDKEISLPLYKESMVKLYADSRRFMNAITIGGIVTLIITLIGLIGYTNNETNRRKSEIAIRKVNGATTKDILNLFLKNTMWISLPAILLGIMVAVVAAEKWMEDFSEKAILSPLLFILCGVAVLFTVLFVVAVNCLQATNQNPIETINRD